jgi:type IV pilus assembly protein PilN
MINLLPHREERRKRRKVAYYAGLGVAALVGVAIVGVWYLVVEQLVSGQQQRNAFLQSEIAKLDVQIKDIASLKAEIASLKARQKAVEDLQIDRNVPVHVLNELVRQVPRASTSPRSSRTGRTSASPASPRPRSGFPSSCATPPTPRSGWSSPSWWRARRRCQGTNRGEQKRLFDFSSRLTIKRPQDAPASAPPAPSPARSPTHSASAAGGQGARGKEGLRSHGHQE